MTKKAIAVDDNMSFESCCDDRPVYVTRVILGASNERERPMVIKSAMTKSHLIVDYKAASNRSGTTRNFSKSRYQITSNYEQKSAIARTIASIAIPGDISPIRSPIRSAISRTLTPGKPGLSGGVPTKPNRGHRCPEGYQYGGRFTDSRLSTCGMKLFDIPSPLGAALSALKRSFRSPKLEGVTSGVLQGAEPPNDPVIRRDPNVQIPKVSAFNRAAFLEQIEAMIKGLGSTSSPTSRMVRRDGFVLEPVVPARVLRSVPDNRDMEGAAYLSSVIGPDGFGKEEVGLLSNTGVNSVFFVLPEGSTISISKTRELTVGERRKLGKTIRAAESMATSNNPTGNMKYIAEEMGDGIAYSESFVKVKNPNEIVDGKPKWLTSAFPKPNLAKKPKTAKEESTNTSSEGKKITSLDAAIEHILNGGKLSDISSETLAKVLAKKETVQTQKINNKQSVVVINGQQYVLYSPTSSYAHLSEKFSSDVQRHLMLNSMDVFMVGGPSDKRKYLVQGVESAVEGSVFNPNANLSDFKPEDVAKMMISDFLVDQRERNLTSIYALTTSDGEVPVLGQNSASGLTDLSKVEITKRMKMSISDFYSSDNQIDYSKYYLSLKVEQQLAYRRMLEQLITRAKDFKVVELKKQLKTNGLSDGELAHLEIIEKIYSSRMKILSSSKKMLINYLKGI